MGLPPPLRARSSVWLLFLAGSVCIVRAAALAPPPPKCQAQLDEFCNAQTSCVAAVTRRNLTLPLYARFDRAQHGDSKEWRCYSGSALSPDRSHYIGGPGYCSTFAAELEGILEACEHPDPHNVIVNATVVFTPAEIAACGFIRTPSPVFTGKSVLLFAQCRVSTGGDGDANSAERPELKDDFRLCRMVMKRSRDMGRTWGAMQFVSPQSTGVGAAVFDRATQQVVLQYQLMPNANPYQGNTLLQVTSADDGATWSAPRDITPALAPCNTDSNNMICGGAGSRIQSSSGRLVFAGHNGGHSVCVWYSDDGGKTYTTSKTPIVGNEISLTEVSPGTLYMNGRNGNHPSWAGNRSAWSSFDNGATWTNASATDLTDVNCEGAVVTANVNGEPVLLFSEPHGPGRISYRIHCSRDKGKTWSRYIQVNQGAVAAYSALQVLPGSGTSQLLAIWEQNPNQLSHVFDLDWCLA